MKFPTKTDIETLQNTLTGKGRCACSAAMIFCMDKQIICTSNAMTEQDDPTAHAAIVATRLKRNEIRKNKQKCAIFLSEKPCPMCVAGIHQAGIVHLFFLENNKIKYMDLRSDNIDNWYEEISVVPNK
jgi:tRNA(Arg) A34 adenosine deaminase TadA